MMLNSNLTIIMIEDDEGHARLIQKNLRRAGISNEMKHFNTGRKALDFFFAKQGDGWQQEQVLILLDLNLPEVDGFEVLATIKKEQATHAIPVIILTTTENPKEINRCYELGCNVYITKPVDYDNFAEAIKKLGLMLAVVKIPEPI